MLRVRILLNLSRIFIFLKNWRHFDFYEHFIKKFHIRKVKCLVRGGCQFGGWNQVTTVCVRGQKLKVELFKLNLFYFHMALFLSSPFYKIKFRNFAELGFGQLWHWKGSSISYLWNGREVYFSWHPRHRFLWRQSREIVLFSSTLCFGFINCTWTINRKSSRYTARASWREWWWYGSGAAFGRTGRINTLTLWREGRRNFSTKMKEDNKNDKFKKQGSVSL